MNVTSLTSITASAVPAAPKQISATQRLAALELARSLQDMTPFWLLIAATFTICALAMRYIPVTHCWLIGHEPVCNITKEHGVRHFCENCKRTVVL